MAGSKRNSVDLINSPIDMGVKAAQDQLDAFQKQFEQPGKLDPIRQWYKDNNIRIGDLRGR
jgi:hypothetical protein